MIDIERIVIAIIATTFLTSGCLGAPAAETLDNPSGGDAVEASGTVTVTFRHPRNTVQDNYEYAIKVTGVDGQKQTGTTWQRTGTGCSACVREEGASGELNVGDDTSAYTYMAFDRVAYNGTWTVELEWKHNNILGVWEGQQVGPFHLYPNDCVFIGLSEINKTPREATVASSDCLEGGQMTFTYDGYNATFDIPEAS